MKIKCTQCGREKDVERGEKCGCEQTQVLSVLYPAEKSGAYSFLSGYAYPFPGFADRVRIAFDDIFKRLLMESVRILAHFPFTLFWPVILLWPKAIDTLTDSTERIVEIIFKGTTGFIEDKRFCRSGREILRVGLKMAAKSERPDYMSILVRGLVHFWELDNAYRFRGQDILSELKKDNVRRNVRKEIVRILKIGISREKLSGDANFKGSIALSLPMKWRMTLLGVNLTLFISRKLRRILREFLLELNVSEVAPDEGDWYYMCERFDYDFQGLDYETRIMIKYNWDKIYPPFKPDDSLRENPQIGILPNQRFLALPKERAEQLLTEATRKFLEKSFK